MNMKYVGTTTISSPTANATPSTNINVVSFHSLARDTALLHAYYGENDSDAAASVLC